MNDWEWTGPSCDEVDDFDRLIKPPVPSERWPYGPPSAHEICCLLHVGGAYCDCKASAADELDWGL